MKVRYTYRLRPGKQAEQYLLAEWGACRYVWNRMVNESKQRHRLGRGETFGDKTAQKYLTMLRAFTIDDNGGKWLASHSCVPQQQIVRDFSKSRKKALLDLKDKTIPMARKAGLPRYKSRKNSQPSLNYRIGGFTLVERDGHLRLRLPKNVTVPVVWSRELPSAPKSVRVYREPDGHWYTSFVVEAVPDSMPPTGRAVGIDWGVKTTAATASIDTATRETDDSDRLDLPYQGFEKRGRNTLKRIQRAMSRRHRKGKSWAEQSRGYRKAKRQYAEIKRRITRQREDTANKWAHRVCEANDIIAEEDFKPRFLAKTTMARKAQDAAIGATKRILEWQADKNQRTIIRINPRNTTQDCSNCGATAKHPLTLDDRTYKCESCGMIMDRDKNSALNMLKRAGFNPRIPENVRRDKVAEPDAQLSHGSRIPRL